MAARLDNGRVQLLTRTGLDWTNKYPGAAAALANLNVETAYLDGELCGVNDAGLPSFAQTQAATDGERGVSSTSPDGLQLDRKYAPFLQFRQARSDGADENCETIRLPSWRRRPSGRKRRRNRSESKKRAWKWQASSRLNSAAWFSGSRVRGERHQWTAGLGWSAAAAASFKPEVRFCWVSAELTAR
jgi:hypothetical protein